MKLITIHPLLPGNVKIWLHSLVPASVGCRSTSKRSVRPCCSCKVSFLQLCLFPVSVFQMVLLFHLISLIGFNFVAILVLQGVLFNFRLFGYILVRFLIHVSFLLYFSIQIFVLYFREWVCALVCMRVLKYWVPWSLRTFIFSASSLRILFYWVESLFFIFHDIPDCSHFKSCKC